MNLSNEDVAILKLLARKAKAGEKPVMRCAECEYFLQHYTITEKTGSEIVSTKTCYRIYDETHIFLACPICCGHCTKRTSRHLKPFSEACADFQVKSGLCINLQD